MSEYFTWVFFQPIILTFLSIATCNQDIFDNLNITCDYNDPAWLTQFFISIIFLLLALFSEGIFALFF